MTGEVILDSYGDREPDYWITDMAENGTFIKVAEVLNVGLNNRVSFFSSSHLSYRVCFDVWCCLSACKRDVKHRHVYTRTNDFTLFDIL